MKQKLSPGAGSTEALKSSQTERDPSNTIADDNSTHRDRAAVVARAVLQIAASDTGAPLSAVAAYLRDEFSDVARHTFNEIRRNDE
jgi:hypothetical protein